MKRPEKIKLGHRDISVSYTDEDMYLRGRSISGMMNLFAQTIEIDTRFPESEVANTLVHELAHFVYKNNQLPYKHEEKVVSALANGFIELFVRNPELLAYLTRVAKTNNP